MILKGEFLYLVNFSKNGKDYEMLFVDLNQVRIHLTYGWDLPFDESEVIKSDKKEIIYDKDGIKIKQIRLC